VYFFQKKMYYKLKKISLPRNEIYTYFKAGEYITELSLWNAQFVKAHVKKKKAQS